MKTTAFAWLIGGALWLVAGVVNHGTYEAIWLAADALLAIGIVGLWRADHHQDSRLGAAGLGLAALGRAAFVVAEIIAAASGNDENALLPAGALLTSLGMALYGVVILRAKTLEGMRQWAPLVVGIYPVAAMFPIVAATGEPSELAIALWGIPLALLGLALASGSVAASTRAML